MTNKLIAGSTVAGLVLGGALVGAVSAQSVANATGLTLEQAIEIALLEVPGEVLEAEMDQEDGLVVFEVEIQSETGEEFEIEVAGATGEILEVEAEDGDTEEDDD